MESQRGSLLKEKLLSRAGVLCGGRTKEKITGQVVTLYGISPVSSSQRSTPKDLGKKASVMARKSVYISFIKITIHLGSLNIK